VANPCLTTRGRGNSGARFNLSGQQNRPAILGFSQDHLAPAGSQRPAVKATGAGEEAQARQGLGIDAGGLGVDIQNAGDFVLSNGLAQPKRSMRTMAVFFSERK
jgi:hypothetical protein